MKRFHVHVAVPDLERSIRFYTTVFGAEPSVVKPDYAKWMLEDPRVNFAISQRAGEPGVNHLGFQVDDADELTRMHSRLQAADSGVVEEKNVSCCYANSDKYWVTDPAGVAWETFRSLGSVPFYNGAATPDACCAPTQVANEKSACCAPARATGAERSCCS